VDPNGEITTAISSDPEIIDPQREAFPNEIAQTLMVYEPLLTFDPKTLQPVPASARALPEISEDGLTVTFTLRDGLSFSDGRPITAGDVVSSLTEELTAMLEEKEFFIRKAIGWALRQYAWTNPKEVERYVHDHEAQLSGLSRREALKNIG